MQTYNLSRPGEEPQDGDLIMIRYANGMTEQKYFTSPKEDPPVMNLGGGGGPIEPG